MALETSPPILGLGAHPRRATGRKTAVNRKAPVAARTLSLNVHRMGLLVLNTGFWTLIILVGRALYA